MGGFWGYGGKKMEQPPEKTVITVESGWKWSIYRFYTDDWRMNHVDMLGDLGLKMEGKAWTNTMKHHQWEGWEFLGVKVMEKTWRKWTTTNQRDELLLFAICRHSWSFGTMYCRSRLLKWGVWEHQTDGNGSNFFGGMAKAVTLTEHKVWGVRVGVSFRKDSKFPWIVVLPLAQLVGS